MDAWDDEASLLQLTLEVTNHTRRSLLQLTLEAAGLGPGQVGSDAPLCPNPLAGVARVGLLAGPLAVSMVACFLLLATWALASRAGGPDSLPKDTSDTSRSACDCKEDVHAPWSVWLSNCAGRFLLSLNFTIVLPSSEEVMASAGGSRTLSGFVVGAYALGSVLATPLAYHLSKKSYRASLVLMGVVTVAGNVAYAAASSTHGTLAITSMIVARALCGLQAGAQVIFVNASQRTASGTGLARLTAKANFSVVLGLVLGPAVSALASAATPGLPPSVAPSVLMAAAGLLFSAACGVYFPHQKELPFLRAEEATEGCDQSDKVARVRECWLSLAVQSLIMFCRFCQRVAWEAGFLTIMTHVYGFSQLKASLLAGVPALVSLPLASQGARLHQLGVHRAMHLLEFTELVGILLMFGWPLGSPSWQVGLFVVGSCLFYSGNWLSVVPLQTLRSGFTLEGHWALNTEAISCASNLASFAGTFYGPVLARAVLSACDSRSMLAGCTATLWLGAFLALEPARAVLLRTSP